MKTPEERFWASIDRRGEDECWPFIGCDKCSWKGGNPPKRRVAWMLTNGAIPKRHLVLTKCGNGACCNPAHLVVGTKKTRGENTKRLGRSTAGIRNPHAKLTERQVLEILALRGKMTQRAIARQYGLGQATVGHILVGKTWKHLHSPR